jgi:hypothetical protein
VFVSGVLMQTLKPNSLSVLYGPTDTARLKRLWKVCTESEINSPGAKQAAEKDCTEQESKSPGAKEVAEKVGRG